MPDEQLEANIAAVIAAVCAHRNPALGSVHWSNKSSKICSFELLFRIAKRRWGTW